MNMPEHLDTNSDSVAMTLAVTRYLANTKLKAIFASSCGLETVLILYRAGPYEGIENLYEECKTTKPKLKSYTEFLRYLESQGLVIICDGSTKKTYKTIKLTPQSVAILESIPAPNVA